jgi:hypothetical protein
MSTYIYICRFSIMLFGLTKGHDRPVQFLSSIFLQNLGVVCVANVFEMNLKKIKTFLNFQNAHIPYTIKKILLY